MLLTSFSDSTTDGSSAGVYLLLVCSSGYSEPPGPIARPKLAIASTVYTPPSKWDTVFSFGLLYLEKCVLRIFVVVRPNYAGDADPLVATEGWNFDCPLNQAESCVELNLVVSDSAVNIGPEVFLA